MSQHLDSQTSLQRGLDSKFQHQIPLLTNAMTSEDTGNPLYHYGIQPGYLNAWQIVLTDHVPMDSKRFALLDMIFAPQA
jgi:hypothetical protein